MKLIVQPRPRRLVAIQAAVDERPVSSGRRQGAFMLRASCGGALLAGVPFETCPLPLCLVALDVTRAVNSITALLDSMVAVLLDM